MHSLPPLISVCNHTGVAVKQYQFLVIGKHGEKEQTPVFYYPSSETSSFAEEGIFENYF